MQRALAMALLHEDVTILHHPGISQDDEAAKQIILSLGADITVRMDGSLRIKGGMKRDEPVSLHCGESGLSIRMFTPIAGITGSPVTIYGSGSLVNRPMDFFNDVLPKLNLHFTSNHGRVPLEVRGPMKPADIEVDGSLSSQFLTGLLMAIGATATQPVEVKVVGLKSKPYIDLTLAVMRHFGYNVSHKDHILFTLLPKSHVGPVEYTVEGDWSGAAFLLVAAAIGKQGRIQGLDMHSTQADRKIMEALEKSGAVIAHAADGILITGGPLKGFTFDATDSPDLFPPLVALAAYCEGITTIQGVSRLRHKESDRAATLTSEFTKMGLDISHEGDVMTIRGGPLQGTTVSSCHDHRIAMALAVAAISAKGETTIGDADAVKKSYPRFFHDLIDASINISFDPKS
jgi:3-phosphoshikimate 1-carboxyvinyltransferase